MKKAKMLAILVLALGLMVSTATAEIIYVDADGSGANNGSSWADAYNYLQDALAVAWSGDEIWVAQGIYKPNQGVGITPGDRTATFQLKNGVAIKGGYAGFGQPDPNARDVDEYETILSGDLAGNDIDVNDPDELLDEPTRAENSYHVVTGSGTDTTAILEGFTITGGNANGDPFSGHSRGGGMYNDNSSPTVTVCTFTGNSALVGGGMYNKYSSSPTITNCTFSGNSAVGSGRWGSGGGGIMNWRGSNPTLINCTFSGNSASYGGGMYNDESSPAVTNCTFSENWASIGGGMHNEDNSSPVVTNCMFRANSIRMSGGGMSNDNSSPMVTNCIFSGNSAIYIGGGMANGWSNPTLTNCTLSGNSARNGGGMLNFPYSNPTLTNCIFSGNSAEDYGGGIFNWRGSNPMLASCLFSYNSAKYGGGMANYYNTGAMMTNCTFAANSATHGNALACDSRPHDHPSNLQVTNTILWDGGDEIWNNDNSVITITYSDIQGDWLGEGNIDAEPCFVESGYWDANGVWIEGDYHLLEDSPCIDVGDPNYVPEPNETDLDGKPRVIGGRIDMGAYEYSPHIPAEVRIVPRTINLASRGKWITCYIWLGEDYNVVEIDPNSILLENEIEARSLLVDEQEQVAIVRFDRSEVQGILNAGQVELTISGELTDGTVFEGTDVIRVIDKGGKSAR